MTEKFSALSDGELNKLKEGLFKIFNAGTGDIADIIPERTIAAAMAGQALVELDKFYKNKSGVS